LNRENVSGLAIESLGPQMVSVAGIDQLNTDSELPSSLADAAPKQRLDAEPFPYIARVQTQSPKGKA
jgi:hypothetical protein